MANLTRPRVVHVTTAHRADDVRIFERECRSLASSGRYDVYIAGSGSLPSGSGVSLIPLGEMPQARLQRFVSGPKRALAMASSLGVDLWHFHDPELLPVALALAHRGRLVIWDAHEDYAAQFGSADAKSWVPGPARPVVRGGMSAALAAIDRKSSGVVSATPSIASRYTNRRSVVVGNEARIEDFADCSPSPEARRVLFAGQITTGYHSHHSFDEVVDAVAGLPGVELAVAGEPPDAAVWARAGSLLGGRLIHLGWLDRRGLAQAMSGSTVGLATYAPMPTLLEPDVAPTKVYEFCAAGLPFVGTPIPSVQRLADESGGGVVAADFSAAGLREALGQVLTGGATWEGLSKSGRSWAKRPGGWADSEARLLGLYQEILGV